MQAVVVVKNAREKLEAMPGRGGWGGTRVAGAKMKTTRSRGKFFSDAICIVAASTAVPGDDMEIVWAPDGGGGGGRGSGTEAGGGGEGGGEG